jgi:5'-nucleotidase
MPYDLFKLLVVGISSRVLFDLADEDRIFQTEGLQAFIDYQHKHEHEVLRPGSGFPLTRLRKMMLEELRLGKDGRVNSRSLD